MYNGSVQGKPFRKSWRADSVRSGESRQCLMVYIIRAWTKRLDRLYLVDALAHHAAESSMNPYTPYLFDSRQGRSIGYRVQNTNRRF